MSANCRRSWPNMLAITTIGGSIDRWDNGRPAHREQVRLMEALKLERSSRYLCSEAFITFISKPHDDDGSNSCALHLFDHLVRYHAGKKALGITIPPALLAYAALVASVNLTYAQQTTRGRSESSLLPTFLPRCPHRPRCGSISSCDAIGPRPRPVGGCL